MGPGHKAQDDNGAWGEGNASPLERSAPGRKMELKSAHQSRQLLRPHATGGFFPTGANIRIDNRTIKLRRREIESRAINAVVKVVARWQGRLQDFAAEQILNQQRRHVALAIRRALSGPLACRLS